MNLNTIQQPLIEALGWTLLHSLWQGLIIAAVLAIAIRFVKTKSPKLSYQLCCLALLSLCLWMGNTFVQHFHWPTEGATVMTGIIPITSSEDFSFFASTLSWQQNIDIFFQSFIQSYASELVMLWLLGVGVFGLKWIGALYFTYTLKSNNTFSAPVEWQNMVKQFSQKLGINKVITIVKSTKVDVPMVIGAMKPVILMPASMATGFTSEQIETIIVHELAHIKSNDFLIGLILSAMEVVLFYHPMYWWVSGIISEEREKCCDDIAVAECGNPLLYARTLFSIAEQKQQRSLALSLQGKKNQLFDRIKRICITPQGKSQNSNNKAGMALGFLFVIAIMALAQVPSQAKDAILEPVKEAIFEPVKEAFIEQFQDDSEEESIDTEVASVEEVGFDNSPSEEDTNDSESVAITAVDSETKVFTDTVPPSNSSVSNKIIFMTKLDENGNMYITKKDIDGQGYAYIVRKGECKIYIDKTVLQPGNHKLYLDPETEILFFGTTLILDRDDIDLDNLDKVFEGDSKASAQYYKEVKEQLEDDSSDRKKLRYNEDSPFNFTPDNFKLADGSYYEEGDELTEEDMRVLEEKKEKDEQRHNEAMQRHEEAMERHQEALERQREAMERQKESMERQREEIERQEENMERQREEMERQEENMERQREALQERMEAQRAELEERMEEQHKRLEEEQERREINNDLRQERNDKFHELLSENLYKDGLIKNKTKYKFQLSTDELKVNRKKQNSDLQQKYLELYQNHYGVQLKDSSNIVIQRS